jgi:hypothetical protein
MEYIGNRLDQGPMVGVVFRASGPPIFRCLFCGISWPMLCCYWFRWANLHNGRHQRELAILRDRGLGSDEVFLAIMASVWSRCYLG